MVPGIDFEGQRQAIMCPSHGVGSSPVRITDTFSERHCSGNARFAILGRFEHIRDIVLM